MINIDGSYNEGGGQILRTALTLSLATRQPFRIEKIRAGRKQPGLLRQHLAAVNAAAKVGHAEVEGNEITSQQLTFAPKDIVPGDYNFSIGTAGSVTLVLQTVLPVLMLAPQPSVLVLQGGTYNPAAPPYDFIERAFVPLLNRIGASIHTELMTAGFYPAGGGSMRVTVNPCSELRPLSLMSRGNDRGRRARALVANLPRSIAERELAVISKKLSWDSCSLQAEVVPSRGPGNVVMLEIENENVTEIFTGFGERNVRAEVVAEDVVMRARRYLASEAAVGEHLADQLLLPLALCKGGVFSTLPPSRHTRTNIETIAHFLPTRISIQEGGRRSCTIEVSFTNGS
jgi:RNA 3'-terminal phosphate cyclase (ATP)